MITRLRLFLLFLVGVSTPIESAVLFEFVFPISMSKIVTALLLGLVVLQSVAERRRFVRDSKNLWVVAFAVTLVIGYTISIVGGVPISSLGMLPLMVTSASVLLFYFLIANVLTSRRELDVLLGSLVVGAVLTAASMILGYGSVEEVSYETRQGGIGAEANLAGYNLVLALAFSFALYFSARSRLRKVTLLGAVGFILVGILVTLSRAAYLSTAAMWGLWMVRFRRLDQLRYALPVVFVAAGIALFPPRFFQERVASFATAEARAEDTSIQKRMGVNRDAVRAFVSSPLVGVGVVGFGTWGMRDGTPGVGYKPGLAIHNAYLSVAAEQGLLGLVPFLLILTLAWRDFSWVRRVARARGREAPELSELGLRATFLQIAYLGGLIENFFQPTLMYKSAWMLLALATAVGWLTRSFLEELQAGSADAPELAPEAFEPTPALGERGASGR